MKITGVIPIRFIDSCDDDSNPTFLFGNKPLWDHTLEKASESGIFDQIVVAYDDHRFEKYLPDGKANIAGLLRPAYLSAKGISSLDVLRWVADALLQQGLGEDDYLMLLEITHPLRPKEIFGQVKGVLEQQPVDSLVTTMPVHYNYWVKDADTGVRRIKGSGDNPLVNNYQELLGICSVFKAGCLVSDNVFGNNVDIIPIDKLWAMIDVRDQDGLWLAEQYLKK